jgi:hypothetical protein
VKNMMVDKEARRKENKICTHENKQTRRQADR